MGHKQGDRRRRKLDWDNALGIAVKFREKDLGSGSVSGIVQTAQQKD